MDEDRFARLSPRQIDCLRLLPVTGSSKGIAEALRITPGTVDQHLKAARRMLGVSDSWTASKLILEHIQGHPQKLDTQAAAVAEPVDREATGAGTADRPGELPESVEVPQKASEALANQRDQSLWELLFPPLRRAPNDLTIRTRVSIATVQALLIVVTLMLLFTLLGLVSRFLAHLAQNGG
jgi:hypothetical protein